MKDFEILVLSKLGVSSKKYKAICELCDKHMSLLECVEQNCEKCKAIVGESTFQKLKSALLPEVYEKYMQELRSLHINYIVCEAEDYPVALKTGEDYPIVLYYVGDKQLLKQKMITIVGSRTPTTYGEQVACRFTKDLVNAGLVTLSGLAYGVDFIVAKQTLESKGKTVAFLAGGLDSIYPKDHTEIARKIVKAGGLILSANPPHKSALKYSFLERNRYMSLLSGGTLIIEAGLKSGTMATANYTIECGRELFVVPGNIYSPKSEGSNKLIEEYSDTIVTSPEKILARLGVKFEFKPKQTKTLALDTDEVLILGAVAEEEKSLDEIAFVTKLDSKILLRKLTIMEINGLIKKLPGNFFIGVKQD